VGGFLKEVTKWITIIIIKRTLCFLSMNELLSELKRGADRLTALPEYCRYDFFHLQITTSHCREPFYSQTFNTS
jgi:hypothetical protein